ncbi:MAG: M15 family metallopeptidase [Lysobacterales bacterium]
MKQLNFGSGLTKRIVFLSVCLLLLSGIDNVLAQNPTQDPDGPPTSGGPYLSSDLVELVSLDPTIKLDIRYATTNNFTGRAIYSEARAFMQRPAAEALVAANQWLAKQGYGLLVYDAYRPWSVTKYFWDITPPDKRIFVADPAEGSRHNRGCAVDIGLYNLHTGAAIEMTGAYDEMSERSFVTYTGGTAEQRAHRDLLRQALERDGYFFVLPEEWWHYDYRDFHDYAVQNISFEEVTVP